MYEDAAICKDIFIYENEVSKDYRKTHNEDLRNLYVTQQISVFKSISEPHSTHKGNVEILKKTFLKT
jgi:hypothetical protein